MWGQKSVKVNLERHLTVSVMSWMTVSMKIAYKINKQKKFPKCI